MELIIEQVSRSKKLLNRYKVNGPHASIGRGYNNDIILNDPYVDAEHLQLSVNQQGQWSIQDHDSTNGSFFENEAKLKHQRPIRSGEVINVGKSYLRFIYPDHPVSGTIRLSGLEGLFNWLSSPLVVMAVLLFYLGLQLMGYYIGSTEVKTSQMFSSVFMKMAMLSSLPLLFSLVARLFKHDARVLTQVALWFCFFTLFAFTDHIAALISFNSANNQLSKGFVYLSEVVLIFSLLWTAFYIALHQSPLRRLVVVGSMTFGLMALSYLYSLSRVGDFNPKPVYNYTLLAPEFVLVEPVSVDQFIQRSEAIFELSTQQAAQSQK